MISEYDLFFFDWDGTLINSLDRWHGALKQSLLSDGYHLDDVNIGADYQAFRDKAEKLGVRNVESIINKAYSNLNNNPETVRLNEHVFEMLTALTSAGKKLAIVTTSTHSQVDDLLKRFELEKYFNAIVCADDVDDLKPHPAPIELAIRLLSGDGLRTVMIGDSSADIIAASSAGINSVLYFPPRYEIFSEKVKLIMLNPTKTISTFDEITKS